MFIISKPISNVKRGLSGIGNMIEQRHSDLYKKKIRALEMEQL